MKTPVHAGDPRSTFNVGVQRLGVYALFAFDRHFRRLFLPAAFPRATQRQASERSLEHIWNTY